MSECEGGEVCGGGVVVQCGGMEDEGGSLSSEEGGSPPPPLSPLHPPCSVESGLAADRASVVPHVHTPSTHATISLAAHHRLSTRHVLVHHHHPASVVANTVVIHPDDSDPDSPPELQTRHLLHHTDEDSELSPSAHVNYKDEPLSVSVVHDDSHLDSHDSGLLSPSDLSPRDESQVSDPNMIDASDFRSLQPEPIYPNISSMNGRMSPSGFSPSSASSYATLTPLQPLPPISTVSDKFVYGSAGNVSGSFTVMQNNGLGNMLSMGSPYQYEKVSMSPPHYISNNSLGLTLSHQHSPLSPHGYQNGLASPQKSLSPNGYDSPYTRQDMSRATLTGSQSPTLSPPVSLHSSPQAFTTFSAAGTPTLTTSSLNMNGLGGGNGLGSLSPHAVSPHSPAYSPHQSLHMPPSPPPIKTENLLHNSSLSCNMNDGQILLNQSPPHAHMTAVSSMPQQAMIHSCPVSAVNSMTMTNNMGLMKQQGMPTTSGGNGGEVEEINTKDLAQRISAELKRYSIPQAIFAQRVLCRSQGTLSDLLRNPKPWSKLKSGRETFRRMWKWLQEPEFQRMSSLRLAVASLPQNQRDAINAGFNNAGTCEGSEYDHYFPLPHEQDVPLHQQQIQQPHQQPQQQQPQQLNSPANRTTACKRKEDHQSQGDQTPAPKKPRLVFTDLQRRTLQAIFKETKRPSKEMQVTIARQLGLEPSTVGNFFMNARRRSMDKWKDDNEVNSPPPPNNNGTTTKIMTMNTNGSNTPTGMNNGQQQMMATIQQSPTTVTGATVVHMPQMANMSGGQHLNSMVGGHCLDDGDL